MAPREWRRNLGGSGGDLLVWEECVGVLFFFMVVYGLAMEEVSCFVAECFCEFCYVVTSAFTVVCNRIMRDTVDTVIMYALD